MNTPVAAIKSHNAYNEKCCPILRQNPVAVLLQPLQILCRNLKQLQQKDQQNFWHYNPNAWIPDSIKRHKYKMNINCFKKLSANPLFIKYPIKNFEQKLKNTLHKHRYFTSYQ